MNLLIATGLYPPESGGPATFAKLAEDELSKKGVIVTVVPFSSVRQYPKLIRHLVYFFKLLKLAKNQDALLALDGVSVGVPAWLLTKLKRLPLIVRLGGDYAWEQGRQRFGVTSNLDDFQKQTNVPFTVKLLRSVQTKVTKSADRVIAPSEYLKSIILGWGVESDKVEVIYSVSYLNQESLGENELPQSLTNLSLDEQSPVLLSISRLVPWKGFATLIDVVNKLKVDFPRVLLLIGGDGPEFTKLQQKITKLGLENNVKLLGRLERTEIKSLSQKVDMFLLNTEYEGFSHLLVEFMSFGVPIITTDVGGNGELITDGVTGSLVPYNDETALVQAITKMANSREQREQYISKAKERVSQFSKKKSIEQLDSLLSNVIIKSS